MSNGYWLLSLRAFDEFGGNIARLVALCVLLQEIREKKHLQDGEHDEQFDQYDRPQRLAQAHRAETIVIEVENPI